MAVDAVDAAAQQVRPDLERERALEPDRLGVESRSLASSSRAPSTARLRNCCSSSESPKPERRQDASNSSISRSSEPPPSRVEALQHLVHDDPEALVDRRLLRDPEDARELVLERADPVGVDVGRRQHQPAAAARDERVERRLGAVLRRRPARSARVAPGVAQPARRAPTPRTISRCSGVAHWARISFTSRQRGVERLALARALDQRGHLDQLEVARRPPGPRRGRCRAASRRAAPPTRATVSSSSSRMIRNVECRPSAGPNSSSSNGSSSSLERRARLLVEGRRARRGARRPASAQASTSPLRARVIATCSSRRISRLVRGSRRRAAAAAP